MNAHKGPRPETTGLTLTKQITLGPSRDVQATLSTIGTAVYECSRIRLSTLCVRTKVVRDDTVSTTTLRCYDSDISEGAQCLQVARAGRGERHVGWLHQDQRVLS